MIDWCVCACVCVCMGGGGGGRASTSVLRTVLESINKRSLWTVKLANGLCMHENVDKRSFIACLLIVLHFFTACH